MFTTTFIELLALLGTIIVSGLIIVVSAVVLVFVVTVLKALLKAVIFVGGDKHERKGK